MKKVKHLLCARVVMAQYACPLGRCHL